jgi:hypothetical protein
MKTLWFSSFQDEKVDTSLLEYEYHIPTKCEYLFYLSSQGFKLTR